MANQKYLDLGRNVYDWHAADKVKFLYADRDNRLHVEIEKVCELVKYVRDKKEQLLNKNS